MKKHQIILLLLILPFSAFSINLADLEVDSRVKQQIADSFALEESIRQATEAQSRTGTVVTVGGDNACDYRIGTTKIQDAINAHTTVEIRIAANDTYNENLVINDNSVSLRGGYSNCTDAANNIQTFSQTIIIRGVEGAEEPVIKILGSTQRNTITVEKLLLTGGEGTTENFPGGGISAYQADAQINLNSFYAGRNRGLRGGGIAIIGGNTDITATDSNLFLNAAQSGGGFYCDGSEVSLIMHGTASRIALNSANNITVDDGGGGGMSLKNGCSFIMYSGEIVSNSSVIHGGGMRLIGGSIATLFGHEVCSLSGVCFGNDTEPVKLRNNQTEQGFGGGAWIHSPNTMLNIYAGEVISNEAEEGRGGAISVTGAAIFTTKRLSKACWSQKNCNYYANNTADNDRFVGIGGVIFCSGGRMSITNTVFANNRADLATVMDMNQCTTSIMGSLMYQNGNNGTGNWRDQYVINNSSGTLEVHHTTIADNNAIEAVLRSRNSDTEIVASIIHDASTGSILSADSTGVDVECTMLHEDTSVTSQVFSVVDDPKFIDRANRNYRLNPETSPAVDYCYANTGNYRDIDFQERGWDDPAVNNVHGPYDIGADETYAVIFANGFE